MVKRDSTFERTQKSRVLRRTAATKASLSCFSLSSRTHSELDAQEAGFLLVNTKSRNAVPSCNRLREGNAATSRNTTMSNVMQDRIMRWMWGGKKGNATIRRHKFDFAQHVARQYGAAGSLRRVGYETMSWTHKC